MTTVSALHDNFGCSDSGPAGVGDDARNHNHLTDHVTLEVSQHARVFVRVNLHLEQGNFIMGLKVLTEIVSLVHLLDGFLKLY